MSENQSRSGRKNGKGIFIVIALAVLGLLGYFVLTAKDDAETEKLLTFESAPERVAFLNENGYIVQPDPERKTVTIPAEFNSAYEEYNEIQLKQGFDLVPYKGCEVTLYSYSVLNYPDYPENITANLLFDGKLLIGGDITYNDSENGFTVPLISTTIQELLKDNISTSSASEAAVTETESETAVTTSDITVTAVETTAETTARTKAETDYTVTVTTTEATVTASEKADETTE